MPTKQLADGTVYEKAVHHGDGILKGAWDVTLKIDGVRAMRNQDGAVVSRNGKPLYNLNHLQFKDAEIFRTDWSTSVSLVRTESYREITKDDVYELSKFDYDDRLNTNRILVNSTYDERMALMQEYVDQGYEGIVLRDSASNKWVKVVPVKTADIRITGYRMGNGRLKGLVGSFETAHGSVGSGLDDKLRDEILLNDPDTYIGKIIEVAYRETTAAGKLRFPAFVRFRFDKDEESIT